MTHTPNRFHSTSTSVSHIDSVLLTDISSNSNIDTSLVSQNSSIPLPVFHTNSNFSQSQLAMNQAQPNPANSVLTMPIPGTKLAPEKFRGDFHKVREFIQL